MTFLDLPHRMSRDCHLDRGQDARPGTDRRAEDGPHRHHDAPAQAQRHGARPGSHSGSVSDLKRFSKPNPDPTFEAIPDTTFL